MQAEASSPGLPAITTALHLTRVVLCSVYTAVFPGPEFLQESIAALAVRSLPCPVVAVTQCWDSLVLFECGAKGMNMGVSQAACDADMSLLFLCIFKCSHIYFNQILLVYK